MHGTRLHFVFGYGSLICSHSRSVTMKEATNTAIPVVVQGLARVWAKRSKRGMTSMGVQWAEDESCVGVLVPVKESDLPRLDEREVGYDRVLLTPDQVEAVDYLMSEEAGYYDEHNQEEFFDKKDLNDNIRIWVYVPQRPMAPTPEYPIVQSYVDTILRGCLSISEQFAHDFISTTKGWHPSELEEVGIQNSHTHYGEEDNSEPEVQWVNDRESPIYIRGDTAHSLRKADKFDRLLKTHRPKQFRARRCLTQ